MPIRMEKDDPQQPRRGSGGSRNTGSGGLGGIAKLLPLLLMFLFKRPKLIIPVLILGAVWYFFFGGSQMLSGGGSYEDQGGAEYSIGATLDQEVYDRAQVFEPLAVNYSGRTTLPSKVSLERFAPSRRHQGSQGSCVGWASAYGARTILQAQVTGQDPNTQAFSPAYLYNQIALSGCQGAYMLEAMKTMQANGNLPFEEFRYDERTCSREPSSSQKQAGTRYSIRGFDRLTVGTTNYKPDITGIKQHLAQGYPVVIGMMVGGTFMSSMVAQSDWQPTRRDYSMSGYGGHAMCLIGYDDSRRGGSFQIMNSWGERWGDQGIAWVTYRDFEHFTKEAYGVYPPATAQDKSRMAVEFGLLDVKSQQTIGLTKVGNNTFRTLKPIKKGSKFKLLAANSIECFIYVFGQEIDKSSYVLFPYTEQHSAYCGITGTRLFPRDHSLKADDVGTKDYIAIVFSKEELNYQELNSRISRSGAASYADKVQEALGNQRIQQVEFKRSQNIAFEARSEQRPAVGMVIEIEKQ